ncbi:hypothetical protein SAMN02745146_3115 [Hymenobacter daecheongensis DSM 21074]|uniref:Uncharacterized protein n=1 Tax=Hymenobacter daecheongensis DSM 21074 TaxID=1121955 RepID=A0A1M6J6C1_9BACT|nr:hypothetical protein [Hymenobacter daecheongensis]SHJ42242.1 hypothetical protein SAMN02745146_3115 [Hymenobacter daecheongensis DSM 21074]
MHRLLLFVFFSLLALTAQAQDLLTKQNGDEVPVKVLEITPTEVRYKRTDNPDGPLISVRRSDVFMIRYANGTKEVMGVAPAPGLPATAPALPPGPVVPGDEEPVYNEVHLGGPRIGFTVLTAGVAEKASEYNIKPFLTQFGWQFETRIFRLPNGTSGLFEVVPLIGGLEQNKFVPSLNALVGIRGPKGFEFGVGPNLTPLSASIALAVGTTYRSHGINFPVNLAVVPGNGGLRFSLLFGFNSRRY